MRNAPAIFMSSTKVITYYRKSSHMHGCKERMGTQRGTKVANSVAAVVDEKVHFGIKVR